MCLGRDEEIKLCTYEVHGKGGIFIFTNKTISRPKPFLPFRILPRFDIVVIKLCPVSFACMFQLDTASTAKKIAGTAIMLSGSAAMCLYVRPTQVHNIPHTIHGKDSEISLLLSEGGGNKVHSGICLQE